MIQRFWKPGLMIAALAGTAWAAPNSGWSAIAYSATSGTDGYSFDQPSRDKAEKEARAACGESGATDCEIVGSAQNLCLLLTTRSGGKAVTRTASMQEVRTSSYEPCGGDSDCQVVRNICAARLRDAPSR